MIFSSVHYIVFFALLLLALFAVRAQTPQKLILLAASYVFYAFWDYRFLSLIVVMSAANWYAGARIAESAGKPAARRWLTAAIVFNLCILGFFKYYNFFIGSAAPLLESMHVRAPFLSIILPVGISFITFEVMSYTIDIYRGSAPPAKSLLDLCLLVAFFPHLVAGPILKPRQFLPQFDRVIKIEWKNVEPGIWMFLLGLVKKLLVADKLAQFVNEIFTAPGLYNSATVWLGVIAFSIQIYCDFSAYSDMAIGSARCMGFDIPRNFNVPYISGNVTEFWRRWHISLSTWLRDYLYISLGGNRKGSKRQYANLMITMLLGGLWHGASWNFVVWGGMHGLALAAHRIYTGLLKGRRPIPRAAAAPLNWLVTFAFVCTAWVFFRAKSFALASLIVRKMFFLADPAGVKWYASSLLFAVPFVAANHFLGARFGEYPRLRLTSFAGLFLFFFTLLGLLYFFPRETSPFIYFQF